MKTIFASFGWVLLLVPFLSIAGTKVILSSAERGSLPSEDRQVSGFHSISSGGAFNVYVKLGTKESLRLEGDQDVLDQIETKVESGELKIRNKTTSRLNSRLWGNRKVTVYITAVSLKGLTVSGSGKMEVSGTIKTDRLDARVSGSGNMEFTANVTTLNAVISGSGEIEAKGTAKSSNVMISGSGEFEAKEFRTDNADIKVSGSGNAALRVEKSLNARVSGSGDIYYSGNPTVNQVKSGSGKVTRM